MICEPGKCCICEKQFSNDHTRIEVTWSNGSVMPIGVCLTCAKAHTVVEPEVKKGITEAHWKYWEAQGASPDKEIVIV